MSGSLKLRTNIGFSSTIQSADTLTSDQVFTLPNEGGNLLTETYAQTYIDAELVDIQEQIDEISYDEQKVTKIGMSGHNLQYIVMDGKLYTTSGSNGAYYNATTCRGLNGDNSLYGMENFKLVSIPSLSPIVDVGGGYGAFIYVLLEDGSLYTCGYNNAGQCGVGSTAAIPFLTLSATDVSKIFSHPSNGEYSVDQNRLFIQKTNGKIYGTGHNLYGALGVGDFTNKTTWTEVTSLGTNVTKLFNLGATYGIAVALKSDGTIWITGANNDGVLGVGNTTNINVFTDVTTQWAGVANGVLDLKVSGGFAYYDSSQGIRQSIIMMITLSAGTIIKTCGNNTNGNLGNGTTTSSTSPVTPSNSDNVKDIAIIGCGANCIKMLKTDNTLWSFGYNGQGQCGNGTTTQITTPTQVLTDVELILNDGQTSHNYGYAIQSFVKKLDKTLWSCGDNGYGQCGVGSIAATPSYAKVMLPIDEEVDLLGSYVTQDSRGITTVITKKGNLYAWGYNGHQGVAMSDTAKNFKIPTQFSLPFVKK